MSTRDKKRYKPYKKRTKSSISYMPTVRKPELKKANVTMATMALNSVGTAWREYDVPGQITPSAAINGRIGRRIEIHSCRFRGVLVGGAIGAGPADEYYNNIRIMIYVMHQAKAGAATTPAATAGFVIDTPLNKYYMPGLDKVLYDQLLGITNQPWAANSCSPGTRDIDFYHKFRKPLLVQYAGDVINSNQTQIFVSMVTDSAAVPHPGFTSGYMEISFYDV